jgi:hypothetical protein
VLYERFFSGDTRYARALYEFLGLAFDEQAEQTFLDWTQDWPARAARHKPLPDETLEYLAEHRDEAAEAWCLERVERQLAGVAEPARSDRSGGPAATEARRPAPTEVDPQTRARARALRGARAHEQRSILRAGEPMSAEQELEEARQALADAGRTIEALERRVWAELQELAARRSDDPNGSG